MVLLNLIVVVSLINYIALITETIIAKLLHNSKFKIRQTIFGFGGKTTSLRNGIT